MMNSLLLVSRPRLRAFLLGIVLAIGALAVPLHSQGPFTAQIENFWRVISTGGRTFTTISITSTRYSGTTFAALGTPVNGTTTFCSDCVQALTCAGAGTGAFATRVNNVWNCLGSTSFPILAPNGGPAAPSYSFINSTNSGLELLSAGVIGIDISGVRQLLFQSQQLRFGSGGVYGWGSTADPNGSVIDTGSSRLGPGVTAFGNGGPSNTSGTVALSAINLGAVLAISGTAPTVTSGFGTTPGTIVGGSTTLTFRVLVGAGAATTAGVIGLPTATTFWNCWLYDQTTPLDITRQTASTTASASFTATIGWTAGDILIGGCTGS
jgi:hypothetical protein